ncbi:SCP2 sterol-binding domain-containing protein [Ancylobacter sp. G4_0304]|uniref:Sterol-binding protein n=1 Tax=Ancylobacter novellus TaxID=921 RepID=A0A2W5R422_ANCNO|nr:MAG: sterol-binding protein [Ancylobacter novellus]
MTDTETLVDAIEEKADALRSLGYKVRFDLAEGDSILLDATGGKVTVSVGSAEADTVLKMSSDNLLKLINGKLSPIVAFSTGRLKVQGSQGVALKLAGLFDE